MDEQTQESLHEEPVPPDDRDFLKTHIPYLPEVDVRCWPYAVSYTHLVFVVDNGRVSTPLHRSILDAIDLVEDGYTAQQIKDILEASREKTVIYVGLSTLEYLKKGGRINATTALAANLLNIKPVMKFGTGKLDILDVYKRQTYRRS